MADLELNHKFRYGSIYEMNREDWWELNKSNERMIPPTPEIKCFLHSVGILAEVLEVEIGVSNYSKSDVEVPIFPSPSMLVVELQNQYLKKTDAPPINRPPVPPPPHVLIVPSKSTVILKKSVLLSEFDCSSGRITGKWKVMTWYSPYPNGEFSLVVGS